MYAKGYVFNLEKNILLTKFNIISIFLYLVICKKIYLKNFYLIFYLFY